MTPLYEWDARKAAANLRKHGVSFEEAATAMDDILSLTIVDRDHSMPEARFVTVGLSELGRLVVVGHTDRNDVIRIISVISARLASKLERKQHETS